ncbi:MAG: hypothetical protein R3B13_35085 [Polyangiaceae bacterium]
MLPATSLAREPEDLSASTHLAECAPQVLAPCFQGDPTLLVVVATASGCYRIEPRKDGGIVLAELASVRDIGALPRPRPAAHLRPAPSEGGFCQLFSWIHALGDDACGALRLYRETEVGTVFVERGRVCWASAPALRRRLSDLLRERTVGFDDDAVDHVVLWCKRTGAALGESLVESGALTAQRFHTALRQQTAEAWAHISAQLPARVSWIPHRRGYDAAYTFTAADLMTELGRISAPAMASKAEDHLRRMLKNGGTGVACLRGVDSAMPIASLRVSDWAPGSLDLAVRWARTLVRAAGPAVVAAISEQGRAIVAWQHQDVVYATTMDAELVPLRLATIQGTLRLVTAGVG